MRDLIAKSGGQALIAPAMQEIPLPENHEALAFGRKLLAGEVDAVIFMTAGGAKTLLAALETLAPAKQVKEALGTAFLLARGPKPAEALDAYGLAPFTVPPPSTWKEILEALDHARPSLQQKTVAIQEYGDSNTELVEELLKRGARVVRVPVYRWTLPEDTGPLLQALQTVIRGEADVVLFTNSNQIRQVIRFAQEEGLEQEFRQALKRTVVASVGPVCSEYLDEYGVPVDLEPERPKMADLVEEANRRGPQLLVQKRRNGEWEKGRKDDGTSSTDTQIFVADSPTRPLADSPGLRESPFLKACRRETTPYTPVWLMRQAGRYMKEYRDIRERHSFLELCKDSSLAAEVTVYAVERLEVDAAIIFSDILVILEPMGLHLEYAKGDGPVIHNPLRTSADIARLRTAEPEALAFVYDAIRATRRGLKPQIPLIGFAGAPFTLASYMIEGGGSRNYIHTKSLMYSDPAAWDTLMRCISKSLVGYLNAQVEAGAQALQLFDSWVGCLSPEDYRRYVMPYSRYVIEHVKPGIPVIHFGTQTGTFIEELKEAGGQVIGIDWRLDLDAAWKRLGYSTAIQGNLDPTVLFAEIPEIKRQSKRILDQAAGRPGHIFNLGHGVLPNTPVGHVKALVDAVHEQSVRGLPAGQAGPRSDAQGTL